MFAYLYDRLSWRSMNRLRAVYGMDNYPAVFVQKGLVSSAVDIVHIVCMKDRLHWYTDVCLYSIIFYSFIAV